VHFFIVFPYRLDPTIDILVRWFNDGSENIVSSSDLQYTPPLKKGSRVVMMWDRERWEGTVVDFQGNSSDSSDDDSDSDVILILLEEKVWMQNPNQHVDWIRFRSWLSSF